MFPILTGFFWSAAYIAIIRQSSKDKTYGMPLVALTANISWEFIFSFIYPHTPPRLQINMAWFVLDIFIVYQFIQFGHKEFPGMTRVIFYMVFFTSLTTSFGAVYFITHELNDWKGAYTAFGINLMMSVLFIDMLVRRGSLGGQSLSIALYKMAGSVCAAIGYYTVIKESRSSHLLMFLYVTTFIFDIIYTLMVYNKQKMHLAQAGRL